MLYSLCPWEENGKISFFYLEKKTVQLLMVYKNSWDELLSIWLYVTLKCKVKIDLAWNNVSPTREHDIFAKINL